MLKWIWGTVAAIVLLGFGLSVQPHWTRSSPQDAVYVIEADGGNGSGVMIAPGLMLTAAHVAAQTRVAAMWVRYRDTRVPIAVLYMDETRDLAIVGDPALACPCATLYSGELAQGDRLIGVGFPAYVSMHQKFITEGMYQGRDKGGAINVSVQIAPGNSGGGIFYNGYLVGIAADLAATQAGNGMFSITLPWAHLARAVGWDVIRDTLTKHRMGEQIKQLEAKEY